jgi:hypothetical protein
VLSSCSLIEANVLVRVSATTAAVASVGPIASDPAAAQR